MNSLERVPFSASYSGEAGTSLQTRNKLVQHLVIELNGISYYVRNRVECVLPTNLQSRRTPKPAIVIHLPNLEITPDAIQDVFERYRAEDDVFQDGFIQGSYLVVQTPSPNTSPLSLSEDAKEYLNKNSMILIICLEGAEFIPPGPYIAINRKLHQPWRLYSDDLGAFTTTVMPDDQSRKDESLSTRFRKFQSVPFTGANPAVPVPSRLYFQKTDTKPLAGMRISVKDNMHLAGVETTLGSRAYTELYGKQEKSSEFVEKLIRKGAVVVGKTKLSAFAGSEVPPTQCVDYFPPWNPRGDGYQGPSGSSSGAGASIAGYSWLDVSLCTDTTGSMRHPASSHGTWGHRTSWDSLPMMGIVPSVPIFDTLCILARSSPLIVNVLSAVRPWKAVRQPTEIIYPTDWFPCKDENQQRMNEDFLAALEDSLGLQHIKLSLDDLWSRTAPTHVRGTAMYDFVRGAISDLNGFDGYHSFDEFRAEYLEKFGKQPYVSPSQKKRWEHGASIPEQDRQQANKRLNLFEAWFDEHVWKVNDQNVRRIMIIPQGRPGANYRDGTAQNTGDPPYEPVFTISMLGTPQVVIPIGQNPYESEASGRQEYAPIMTTLVGPNGSDLTLLSIAEETLRKASWQSTVLTGRHMLALGDNNVRNSK